MNEQTIRMEDMQAAYRQWDAVHSTWRADVERWQREHQAALAELAKLQGLVRQHCEAVDAHLQEIERCQQDLCDNQRAMSEFDQQSVGEDLQRALFSKHLACGERHRAQRIAHERIDEHHQKVMKRVQGVTAALEAAM